MKYVVLSLVLVLSILFVSCGENEKPKEAEPEKKEEGSKEIKLSPESLELIKIETEIAEEKPLTGYIVLPAAIVPDQSKEARVGSLVQGRVKKVFVNVGDRVSAGQVLMTIEGTEIGSIKASFMKAKAVLDFAKSALERQKKLYSEKIGAQKSLLETQAEYDKALAEFRAEDKRIHSIGLTDEDVLNSKSNDDHTAGVLPVRAPLGGIIAERNVIVGQYIDASTNAFLIQNNDIVWIDGQVFEKDLAKFDHKTEAVFSSSVYPKEQFAGKVIFIGQTVDEKTRTLPVRAEFKNPGFRLKPGMFGELRVPYGENVLAFTLPTEAVETDGEISYVFVRTADTIFEQRVVVPGRSVGNRIEIKEGLKAGDCIVTQGVFYIKSEMKKGDLEGDD